MSTPATPVRFWVEFPDPSRADDAVIFRCDLTWLTSRWQCLFGKGCPGIVSDRPDDGCCTYGAHLSDVNDRNRVAAAVMQLSAQDWQYQPADWEGCAGSPPQWLADAPPMEPVPGVAQPDVGAAQGCTGQNAAGSEDRSQKHPDQAAGHALDADGEDQASAGQTSLVDGACIFLNRPNFPTGAGCALHQLAVRTGQSIVATKPEVCWQLPIRRSYEQSIAPDDVSRQIVRIGEFDRAAWGPGGHDLAWYCTRELAAHSATEPLYLRARSELVELMGEPAYQRLAELAALFASGRAGGLRVPESPDARDFSGAG